MKRPKPGNPAIAIAYLRVSTDDQRLGPDAQRASIEQWATGQGITVQGYHIDHGISGAAPIEDRPGLVAALAALRSSHAGVLVVARRDRLARDPLVAGLIERAAGDLGAHVVTADGIANGSDASAAFLRSILDAVAAYERSLIRARTKAALAVKRQRGERTGEIPWGMRLGPDGRTLQPDPCEQATITEVRRLRTNGLSLRRIAQELWQSGHRSRMGGRLQAPQVAAMLARNAL